MKEVREISSDFYNPSKDCRLRSECIGEISSERFISAAIKKVGKYSSEAHNITVHHWGEGHVEIGAFCSIGRDVHIILGGRHNTHAVSTYAFGYMHRDVFTVEPPKALHIKPNVIIGNDVWIGREVSIMRGVTIGDGAVVAARSHVVEDVKPYEVVGGNPARHINWRFHPRDIEVLLAIKWWDLPDEMINKISPLLLSGDVRKLVDFVNWIYNNKESIKHAEEERDFIKRLEGGGHESKETETVLREGE